MPDYQVDSVVVRQTSSTALLGMSDLIEGAELRASNALPNFDPDFMKTNDFSKPFRSANSGVVINATFPYATPINLVAVVGHNLTQEALMKLDYYEGTRTTPDFVDSAKYEVKISDVVTPRPAWFTSGGLVVDEAAVVKFKSGYITRPDEEILFVFDIEVTEGRVIFGGDEIYNSIASVQQGQNTLLSDSAAATVEATGRYSYSIFCPDDETYQGRYFPEIEFVDIGSGVDVTIKRVMVTKFVQGEFTRAVDVAYKWGERPWGTFAGDGKSRPDQVGAAGTTAYVYFEDSVVASEIQLTLSDTRGAGEVDYVEIPRLLAYDAFWAAFNPSDHKVSIEHNAKRDISRTGVVFREHGVAYQVLKVDYAFVLEGEGRRFRDLARFGNTRGGALFIPNPGDYIVSQRESVFGDLGKSINFSYKYSGYCTITNIKIEEIK